MIPSTDRMTFRPCSLPPDLASLLSEADENAWRLIITRLANESRLEWTYIICSIMTNKQNNRVDRPMVVGSFSIEQRRMEGEIKL